jgi:hypothetical protein
MVNKRKLSAVISGISFAVALSPLFFIQVFIGTLQRIGIVLLVAYLLLAIGQIVLVFIYSASRNNWRINAARSLMLLLFSIKVEFLGLRSLAVFGLLVSALLAAYAIFYDRWQARISVLKDRMRRLPKAP